jgi:hypothetical protein
VELRISWRVSKRTMICSSNGLGRLDASSKEWAMQTRMQISNEPVQRVGGGRVARASPLQWNAYAVIRISLDGMSASSSGGELDRRIQQFVDAAKICRERTESVLSAAGRSRRVSIGGRVAV